MVTNTTKGNSFAKCFDYITRAKKDGLPPDKREWHILGSDGVRLREGTDGWRKLAAEDLARPLSARSPIKDPCVHISLDFKAEDAPRLDDAFMLKIALEYMEKMGIKDTPFVIVRHTDKAHPHCHLIFCRSDINGKIIKSATNFRRNTKVCREITDRYNLTLGNDKFSVNPEKLRGAEKAKYEIAQTLREVMADESISDFKTLKARLSQYGISAKPYFVDDDDNARSIIYKKDGHSFLASKIDKHYTPRALDAEFARRKRKASREYMSNTPDPNNQWAYLDGSPIPMNEFAGIRFTPQQELDYISGRPVIIDGVAVIRYDFDIRKPIVSAPNMDMMQTNLNPFRSLGTMEDEMGAISGGDGESWKEFRKKHMGVSLQTALEMFRAKKRNQHTNGGFHIG